MKTVNQLLEEIQLMEATKVVSSFNEDDINKVVKTHQNNQWVAHEDVHSHLDSLLSE